MKGKGQGTGAGKIKGKKGKGPPPDAAAGVAQPSWPDVPSSHQDVQLQPEWWPESYQGDAWEEWYDDPLAG